MTTAHAIPQYRQVAETLRRRILDGLYRQGRVMPPASELERQFSVSNITIRRALSILSDEGWITGRRGLGTVVNPAPEVRRVAIAVSGNFRDWLDSASGTGLPIEQTVMDVRRAPGPAAVARTLGLPPEAPLWSMRRRRRLDGRPLSFHVNYGAPGHFDGVEAETMAGNRNFVDVLRDDLGLPLQRMDQTVEAAVADRDLAEILEVDFGDPLYFMENVYRVVGDAAVAVTHLYFRGDRCVYQTSISLIGQ
ncbi:MAG: GntR family transcriptional regulator [Alphaproteobacteria bacterium]|mgnify:CR=1 FL=1|jgi:DNA-binding GntR family transcriptional regulator|nr:GntR family transcriptional regulator [Alphaproteobacteria bacterium]MDP6623737.1 GntR family transcriptional regulator [Alphaproteobacteria bacterium]|tara:strand:+ start:415 stop:1164 length:750 start_codon:yes stop_codon:yes gene_type:complete